MDTKRFCNQLCRTSYTSGS
ncbi:hypothetical protein ACGRQ9_01620 [Vibrio rumoiensis]|uniref:Uncharacterized protein n=1 Tax=Vibrio rumoiensis TaxID=76258 RepID=A0ABW7IRL8_9VIBR